MAKPKIDFKQLFMEKGEKITIVVAGVLMVLFLSLGILAVATSASTDGNEKEISGRVKTITDAMNSSAGTVDPLDESLMTKVDFPRMSASQFRETDVFVEFSLDNPKRGRPRVLEPDEFQVDLIRAPIYVYHFNADKTNIYVIKEVAKSSNLKADRIGERVKAAKKPAAAAPGPGPGP